jgi:hypothetical protein
MRDEARKDRGERRQAAKLTAKDRKLVVNPQAKQVKGTESSHSGYHKN